MKAQVYKGDCLEVLENIAQAVGVCKRGNGLSDEQLVNLFLYATKDDPSRLI